MIQKVIVIKIYKIWAIIRSEKKKNHGYFSDEDYQGIKIQLFKNSEKVKKIEFEDMQMKKIEFEDMQMKKIEFKICK